MFAKSKISFTVDHVFEKNATHQFVSDVRSTGHLNITELPNQKQVSLKKLKKYGNLQSQDFDNQDDGTLVVSKLNSNKIDDKRHDTEAEFVASGVVALMLRNGHDNGVPAGYGFFHRHIPVVLQRFQAADK